VPHQNHSSHTSSHSSDNMNLEKVRSSIYIICHLIMNEYPVCKKNYIQFHLIMNESLFASKITLRSKITFNFQQNFKETAGSSQHVWLFAVVMAAKILSKTIFQFNQPEYFSVQATRVFLRLLKI
jgi:hypothetical protein